jgi:hypothetical protein
MSSEGIMLQTALSDNPGKNPQDTGSLHFEEPRAQLVVKLTHLALSAPDIPSAVMPALAVLVERTAAAGSAYFQTGGGVFGRSASGTMPQGPMMEAILAHGLPADTLLMRALEGSSASLFFDDTAAAPETAGFPELASQASPQHPCWIEAARCRRLFDAHL